MFELEPFYKTLFYLAAAILGVEITFTMSFLQSSENSWQYYMSFIALSFSAPMLIAACLAALFGYFKELQTLLISGALFAALWFILILMNYSIVSGVIFTLVGLVCYKMLEYRHIDTKKSRKSHQPNE